jgi:hypothetical protein
MNAVRKNEFIVAHPEAHNGIGRPVVFEARPLKNPPSYAEMRAEIKKRFAKTLAYLAR